MLEAINYCPILKTKLAEVSAYRNLSEEVKELTLPVFFGRPWPNASHFELTKKRVLEAVSGHPFAFGLDSDRRNHSNARPAQREFDQLFDETGGYRSYYSFIETMAQAIPVLLPSRTGESLLFQLGNADTLNRGLIVHLTRDSFVPVLNLASTVPPLPQDTVFVIDAGWSRNYELLEQWVTVTLTRVLASVPDAEVVIAASSFPDSFSGIIGNASVPAHELRIFRALRQRFNQADLTFGDWGSTRKSQEGGGGAIPARVDVPHGNGWEVFRADVDANEDYGDVAGSVQAHECFASTPNCFGKEMILNTPGAGGITGPAKATESRINIHLTVRSEARHTLDTDEAEYHD